MMIEITAAAAEQIRAALAAATDDGLSLRLAARRAQDGEIEYGMGLDERRDQDQEVATAAGITLLVSPPSLEPLAGTVIDYVEIEPGNLRFVFYRAGSPEPDGDAAPPERGGGD
jgi:iron-sulfur cluster assembly protein